MDDFCSLFPLQQQDGFLPKSTSFSTTILEFTIPQNQVTDHSPLNINNKGKKQQKASTSMENSNLQKKIVHRDFERQRRQEMAKLYESLRSVIPHELLKNNSRELEFKRDKLKNLVPSNDPDFKNGKFSVTVKSCAVHIEVLISGEFTAEGLPLSRVLEILLEEGLNIINCFCTRIDGKLYYTIHSEVVPTVNLHMLQQKLSYMISTQINFK
ncbi:transcription factor bHLH36-like isoform X2 [Olea europaea var. sylvestris]|uniref:transcription factor bHLH36-like isoform X2 n=1 Tax=Olea europaea var. sylvestris TaxID=158386 RepID=UPI000C1D017A|nr:transcription factor bHLH36-like isoform X2 [Olea europaea var. sylvestris]